MKQYLVKINSELKGIHDSFEDACTQVEKLQKYYKHNPQTICVVPYEATLKLIKYAYQDYMDPKPNYGFQIMDVELCKEWCKAMSTSAWSGRQWISNVYNSIDETILKELQEMGASEEFYNQLNKIYNND